MAELEGRIEKAALVIQEKTITKAGASETSSKSPEAMKNIPPKSSRLEKVGLRPAEANLNNYCHTFSKEELSSSSARTTENTLLLQTEKEAKTKITQTLSEQVKWFGRRQ